VTLHFVIFLVFPVEYHLRPDVDPERGWAYLLVDFYYWLDLPYNCFPSLHVSNVVLVSFFMERFKKGMGWFLHPLAALVAVSVVLVKQHYIADVVAGYFVGWFVYRQIFIDSKA
jgi:membrane-associated phospholipid phosphatase